MRLDTITTKYLEEISEPIEEGILYISEKYGCAIHLCACGCKQKTVTPLGQNEWILHKNTDSTISLTPSIGNFNGEKPYHAHYYITNNKIIWC